MSKYLAWALYGLGCIAAPLAWTDNFCSRRWEWPYRIYSFCMVSSDSVQGAGDGPWNEVIK